jgi:hypothetical protein
MTIALAIFGISPNEEAAMSQQQETDRADFRRRCQS